MSRRNQGTHKFKLYLAAAAAVTGVVLTWRAYGSRNEIAGFISEDADAGVAPEYPPPRLNQPDPPFPERVERVLLPAIDLASNELPVELTLPAQKCGEPLRIEGELSHSHPNFIGAIVRVTIQGRTRDGSWVDGWGQGERSVLEGGKHIYRVTCPVQGARGTYRVQVRVTHQRLDVEDLESLPGPERFSIYPVAQGTIEFRE